MITERTALWLGRLAARGRGVGTRGPIARWALRRLVEAGDRDDQAAAEAVWQVWLAHPAGAAWEALTRWREPSAVAEAALEAAVDPARPAASRAAIGEFCTRRGLAPADRVRQALFFVLTGQAEQHRALDPDGSLLTVAYRGADAGTRAALRQMMAGAGDLDMVRAVTGADRAVRAVELSGAEAGHLARQLAGREEWEQLWRLVREVPLEHAVPLMRWFGDWRPDGDPDRRLFARLATADPETVAAACAMLRATSVDLEVTGPLSLASSYPWKVSGSLSPDLRRFTIAVSDLYQPLEMRTVVETFSLPDGKRIDHQTIPNARVAVVHLGDAMITREEPPWAPQQRNTARLVRWRGGRSEVLYEDRGDGWPHDPFHCRDGFATVTRSGDLLYGTADGATLRRSNLVDRQLAAGVRVADVLAVDDGGQLAVRQSRTRGHHRSFLIVFDKDLRVVARRPSLEMPFSGAFVGPGQLAIETKSMAVGLFQVGGGTLEARATCHTKRHVHALKYHPARGQLVVHHRPLYSGEEYEVTCLDATSLAKVRPPPELADDDDAGIVDVWIAPRGGSLAVARRTGVTVHNLLAERLRDVIDRPLAQMTVADVASVTAAERQAVTPEVRTFVSLLRDCLDNRFAAEVALGDATREAYGDTDIELSAEG